MLNATEFREMWSALSADEDRQIKEATDRIRAEGTEAKNALIVLWRRFNPSLNPPVNLAKPAPAALPEDTGTPDHVSMLSAVKRAALGFSGSFTSAQVLAFLNTNYPELKASEKREQISSALSKMVNAKNPLIEIERRGEQGMPHLFRKRQEAASSNGKH
jgi:hypothetical protein